MLSVQTPWYADIVNYLTYGVMPFEFSYQQRRKLRTDCRLYIWDDLLLYRRGANMIIRRCVLETKQGGIMEKCHALPYGGHFTGDKTTQKILQSGFYWPTLFKDYFEWVKHFDACYRMRNLSRRNEMLLQGIMVVQVFYVWRIDFMGPFPSSFGNMYILLVVDYVTK